MFLQRPSPFWYAVALLVASTVGIGFFGIPYAFAQAGTGFGFFFLIGLTGLVLVTNLLYGEIILRTHERHQFVGYVRTYLGKWARIFNLFTFWVSVYGACIGILIINGEFLAKIIGFFGGATSPIVLSMLFILAAVGLVYAGLKTVSHVDFFVMALSIAIVVLIALFGLPHIMKHNFAFGGAMSWFLPFGIILFALNGVQGIPLVREALVGREHHYRRAIIVGTLIPAALYAVFALTVVGVSGGATTPEAISGLLPSLGKGIVVIGSLFGFLTSSTIFLSIVTAFRTSLREDFRLRRRGDFFLPLLPALVLFLAGVRNFIAILSLVGGVAVSIDAILLIFVYAKAKEKGDRIPEYSLAIPRPALYGMILLFALGAVYTITR